MHTPLRRRLAWETSTFADGHAISPIKATHALALTLSFLQIPEEMQLNVSKKRRELVLLEESLYTMKTRFNRKFLALRAIKREILSTIAADNRRLGEIDAELGAGNTDEEGVCGDHSDVTANN